MYVFCNNYCSSHPFILKCGMGKFFGVRNLKIRPRRLKNKPVLRYLKFQILCTCDWTGAEKYIWPDRKLKKIFFFFYRHQPIIEPKMAFDSLLGSSKWCYKFWSFLNTRNLLLANCIIVYSQKIRNWDL